VIDNAHARPVLHESMAPEADSAHAISSCDM
jgi:hypothetical protein